MKKREKKKESKWRHTSSVFSGHPPLLLVNSFFRRRPSPSHPSVPGSFFRAPRALPRPVSLFTASSRDPAPSSILQAHPVPPDHLLVRPRYADISKREQKETRKTEGKKGEKHGGAPASQQNVKLGYVKTGGGDFH